jgi:hypothetical protein
MRAGGAGRTGAPPVASGHQGELYRVPCRSRGTAHGPLLVSLAGEDIFLDKPGQPGRQDLARITEVLNELVDRVAPACTSRMIRAVHASPNRSVARATELATL